jgi:hypothetical protein
MATTSARRPKNVIFTREIRDRICQLYIIFWMRGLPNELIEFLCHRAFYIIM